MRTLNSQGNQFAKVITNISQSTVPQGGYCSVQFNSPFIVSGGELMPVCRRLASLRISIMSVANSRALNLASFCLP